MAEQPAPVVTCQMCATNVVISIFGCPNCGSSDFGIRDEAALDEMLRRRWNFKFVNTANPVARKR